MDFVDWCQLVLRKLIEASKTVLTDRSIGVNEGQLAPFVFGEEITKQIEYQNSSYYGSLWNALAQLEQVDLVQRNPFWKITREGREIAQDPLKLWWQICEEKLEEEHKQVLGIINRLSPHTAPDHAWLEQVERPILEAETNLGEGIKDLFSIVTDLEQWKFINGRFYLGGGMRLSSTYRGLVWETRQGFTQEAKLIDNLVKEWETTSVDFKRELYTDTADQKAEFIKDILSLATTQASGQRWLIIGFDDKTHRYYGAPNPKLSQNHIEQLLKQYTSPMVDVHYEIVDYRQGKVGKLEILRDPKRLPYCVAKSLVGDKKRIEGGTIFVRHGSQVEQPTPAELQALLDEREYAVRRAQLTIQEDH